MACGTFNSTYTNANFYKTVKRHVEPRLDLQTMKIACNYWLAFELYHILENVSNSQLL